MYLKTEKHSSYNTETKFLQNLKRVTSIYFKNGWLQKDPFASISLKLKEVDRPYLTNEELMKLMEFNSPFERLCHVCDLFIFSCFTGLSYIDIKKLKRIEIEGNAEYGFWIRTRRQKTGSRANIPILKMAKVILDKYCDLNSLNLEDSVLPVLSNQKMNAYLKEIADICQIQKPLSFHIARHTFATTVTMMNGVPIESVSKMLGHKNIKSTQHYARIVDEKVGKDMKKLAEKLNKRYFKYDTPS